MPDEVSVSLVRWAIKDAGITGVGILARDEASNAPRLTRSRAGDRLTLVPAALAAHLLARLPERGTPLRGLRKKLR